MFCRQVIFNNSYGAWPFYPYFSDTYINKEAKMADKTSNAILNVI